MKSIKERMIDKLEDRPGPFISGFASILIGTSLLDEQLNNPNTNEITKRKNVRQAAGQTFNS